jgi:hypothetical protein
MKKLIFIIPLLTLACANISVRKSDGVYTIHSSTDLFGKLIYHNKLDEKALELCPNGYIILEKTKTPKTVDPDLYKKNDYYWIVKCK